MSPALNPPASISPRIVRCPSCAGDSVYAASNPYRPFCCATCKGIDLGAWASEQYRVPAQSGPKPGSSTDSSGEPEPESHDYPN